MSGQARESKLKASQTRLQADIREFELKRKTRETLKKRQRNSKQKSISPKTGSERKRRDTSATEKTKLFLHT